MTEYRLKRAYDAESPADGYRVYVDRLWPQGLSHATFHYDLWAKDIAPSTALREWFHADRTNRYDEFARRYMAELAANPAFARLKGLLSAMPVATLLYSSRDSLHNNAVIVRDALATHTDQSASAGA